MKNKLGGFILGFSLVILYWFSYATFIAPLFEMDRASYVILNSVFIFGMFILLLLLWFKFKPLFLGALLCAILTFLVSFIVSAVYTMKYNSSEKSTGSAAKLPNSN